MLTLVTPSTVIVTGTTTAGSAVVTVPSTSAIAGALGVTGTGVAPGSYVLSFDAATQVTLTKNATASGTVSLTFALEPVTLAEAKAHLAVDGDCSTDDPVIAALITAARRKCEVETERTFLTSTWDYTVNDFPRTDYRYFPWGLQSIRVPNPPLVSVTSITYIDQVGSSVVLSGSLYQALAGTPGLISPTFGAVWPYGSGWPSGRYQPNGVIVRYIAGYGTAAQVPETVKAAIKLFLAYLFENRGDEDIPIPRAVAALLACDMTGAYH